MRTPVCADPEPADAPPVLTVGQALCDAARVLRAAPLALDARGARLEARLLLAHVLAVPVNRLLLDARLDLGEDARVAYRALLDQRGAGRPVARLTGRRGFWSLDLALGPDTLEPRPDSETLIEAALATLGPDPGPVQLLDLGTGTGCLLLALLTEWPQAIGWGVDLAAGAVAVATANARTHRLDDRATVWCGDLGRGDLGPGAPPALPPQVDVVITNPPYIPTGDLASLPDAVRDHDPRLALDGGADGLGAYRAVAARLVERLVPGGHAFVELGAGQASSVSALMARSGLQMIGTRADLGGHARCLVLQARTALYGDIP